MSLVDLNSATWTLELPNLFEGGLGLTPFTRGHRTTYLPEKVEVKLVLIRNSAQFTRVMWVHTWVRIRIAIGAILLLTSASGQTVAKRVRSPSQPKIGAVKKLLDAARKMPGAIDEAIEGISNHDMQSMIDGSNKIIKRFKQGQRWFNELRQRLAEDKYPDVVPNSTEAERLRSEIFECFPITQERCFTPCGLSSNRKYRFCYLDSKNSRWQYCHCNLKEEIINLLIAEKNRLLEAATVSTLSNLEFGLIGGSAVLALVAISLLVYVIYGAICRRRMTKRITKIIKAQAGSSRGGEINELRVMRGPNNDPEAVQARGVGGEGEQSGGSETNEGQTARAVAERGCGPPNPIPMDGKRGPRLPRDRGLPEGAAARGQGPVDALPRVPSTRRARGSEEDHQ